MTTGYEIEKRRPLSDFTRLLGQNTKIALVNTLFFLLLSLFIATVPVTQTTGYISLGMKAFQLLAFLGLGVLNTYLLDKYQRYLNRDIHKEKLLYTILLTAVICVMLLVFYYLVNNNIVIMAYASSSSFLLPLTIQQAWTFFENIPEKQYKLWYYPQDLTDVQVPKFRNGIPVHFKLPRRYFDTEEAVIDVKAPEPMILSKRFHLIILEQNKDRETMIEWLDRNKKPFGWKFYLQRFGGLVEKRLDPDLSFVQNDIPKNAIISARRERVDDRYTGADEYTDTVNDNLILKQSIPDHETEKY